jgi:tetratricopeptide (TPR) repeat protein
MFLDHNRKMRLLIKKWCHNCRELAFTNLKRAMNMGFLRTYLILLFPVSLLCTLLITAAGWQLNILGLIIVVLMLNLIPAGLVMWFCEKTGSVAAKLYKGYSYRSISEQYHSYITQARYQKTKEQYEKALQLIELYLEKDPDNSEALYLKAQILLEGFNDRAGAKLCIDKILKSNSESDCWTRWALHTQDKLNEGLSSSQHI